MLPAYAQDAGRLLAFIPGPERVLHVCAGEYAWTAAKRLRQSGPNPITGAAAAVVCLPPGRPWSRYRWERIAVGALVMLRMTGPVDYELCGPLRKLAVVLLTEGARTVCLDWTKNPDNGMSTQLLLTWRPN